MFYIRMADLLIRVDNLYPYMEDVCRDYIVHPDREEDAYIAATPEDVEFSLNWHFEHEGVHVDPGFAEYTQAHQKLYAHIVRYGAFWVHAAVVGMDGYAYGFTGPSGYGKSTHVHLWQKVYGERAQIINGDNPVIRRKDGVFCAFGTPFGGKDNEQMNIGLPLKGYCFLEHGDHNELIPMGRKEAGKRILEDMFGFHIVRRRTIGQLLDLMEEFTAEVPVYRLICNTSEEAAVTAYEGMQKGWSAWAQD